MGRALERGQGVRGERVSGAHGIKVQLRHQAVAVLFVTIRFHSGNESRRVRRGDGARERSRLPSRRQRGALTSARSRSEEEKLRMETAKY